MQCASRRSDREKQDCAGSSGGRSSSSSAAHPRGGWSLQHAVLQEAVERPTACQLRSYRPGSQHAPQPAAAARAAQLHAYPRLLGEGSGGGLAGGLLLGGGVGVERLADDRWVVQGGAGWCRVAEGGGR
jgi:hypothetical protein